MTTTPDFRAELQRLVDLYYALGGNWSPHGYTDTWNDALTSARAALATPPPEPPPTPDLSALAAIGERLRTQDNRCTAHPAFQVRGLRRIYGMDLDYADESVWIDNGSDCIEIDPPEDPENPGDFIIKTGYQDHWEIIMVAFSEQACLDYIKHNGHRHGVYRELEVYADSFYRCPEMLAIREALMAPPGESASPPEPPTVPWADMQVATEKAFHLWWDNEGSGMPPEPNEETVVHVERISKLAWSNGAYVAYARWGR